MGFRNGGWATCWSIEPKSDTMTQVRVSTSRKDKMSGEYVQDFSGFVSFIGTSAAKKAANLKPRDRIKLGEIEVTTKYDRSADRTYTNFNCYSFDLAEEKEQPAQMSTEPQPDVEDQASQDELPF